jgi:hypothetical protein
MTWILLTNRAVEQIEQLPVERQGRQIMLARLTHRDLVDEAGVGILIRSSLRIPVTVETPTPPVANLPTASSITYPIYIVRWMLPAHFPAMMDGLAGDTTPASTTSAATGRYSSCS